MYSCMYMFQDTKLYRHGQICLRKSRLREIDRYRERENNLSMLERNQNRKPNQKSRLVRLGWLDVCEYV